MRYETFVARKRDRFDNELQLEILVPKQRKTPEGLINNSIFRIYVDGNVCFCISGQKAEDLLKEFYDLIDESNVLQ